MTKPHPITAEVATEVRRLAALGWPRKRVAKHLALAETTLGRWAEREALRFEDGRSLAQVAGDRRPVSLPRAPWEAP